VRPRRRARRSRFVAGAAARLTAPAFALLLVPLTAAAWAAVWALLRSLHLPWQAFWPAAAGAAADVLFHAIFPKPMGLYVFGHELTHALTAWLSGYRVKSLKVSASGGEVVTSDTNVFVALAPYCVPLYTVGVVLLYALVRHHSPSLAPPLWCAFGVGVTFAFHVALTVHALRQRQPDLDHAGTFLSLVIIALCNAASLALLLKFLFPGEVSLSFFGRAWWEAARDGGRTAWEGLSTAAAWARGRLR
jgi:hypothetical protein